jgi:hypothetical protein
MRRGKDNQKGRVSRRAFCMGVVASAILPSTALPVPAAAAQVVPVELLTTRFLRSWYAREVVRLAGTQYWPASS